MTWATMPILAITIKKQQKNQQILVHVKSFFFVQCKMVFSWLYLCEHYYTTWSLVSNLNETETEKRLWITKCFLLFCGMAIFLVSSLFLLGYSCRMPLASQRNSIHISLSNILLQSKPEIQEVKLHKNLWECEKYSYKIKLCSHKWTFDTLKNYKCWPLWTTLLPSA